MPLSKKNVNNGFQLPTITKVAAENSDFFIGIDNNGVLYKIAKANLLAGITATPTPTPTPTPPTIPLDAITGFDGVNQFLIEAGSGYLSY